MTESDSPEIAREFKHQWEILSRGAVDILPEDEFERKLKRSISKN